MTLIRTVRRSALVLSLAALCSACAPVVLGGAMVGGAMLLMYEVAWALFIGLGPIFILCLLFDVTKSLFQRWLLYGIGTMFSMAVLAAMIAIATKTVLAVAEAFWASALIGSILGTDINDGMNSIALQQGGIGLIAVEVGLAGKGVVGQDLLTGGGPIERGGGLRVQGAREAEQQPQQVAYTKRSGGLEPLLGGGGVISHA